MKQGQSIRSGQARIQYDPEWSAGRPYKTYSRGTAGPIFPTLYQALAYFGFSRAASPWSDWT